VAVQDKAVTANFNIIHLYAVR